MQNAILVGLSRQVALAREMDVVANNIANLNTTGYKADGSVFEEILFLSGARRPDRHPHKLRAGPRHVAQYEPGRGRAHRQSTRCRDRRPRLPGRAERRRATVTPATARCRSTPPVSSSPATAMRCSATAAQSRCSRTTVRYKSAATARSACAKAPRTSISHAARFGWSILPIRSSCRKPATARSIR